MKITEKILIEMLTESTGTHYMDSGNHYGRHWEENQKHLKTGELICDSYNDDKSTELIPIVPIFDILNNGLEYTEECQYLESLLPNHDFDVLWWIEEEAEQDIVYHKLTNLIKYGNVGVLHMDLIGARIQLLGSTLNYANNLLLHLHQSEFKVNNYIGTKVCNTYGSENVMTQDYQSIFFEYNFDDYIAISIHNGCDIRGGYTDTHIFKVEYIDEFLISHNEACVECECGENCYRYMESHYYYDANTGNDIGDKEVYKHTYIDNEGYLRCNECDGYLMSFAVEY